MAATSSALEAKLNRYLGDLAGQNREVADKNAKLVAIKNKREDPAHLKALSSTDEKAHRLDEDLAKRQARIEKEISIIKKDSAVSQEYADRTRTEIANDRLSLNVEAAMQQSVSFENSLLSFNPVLEELKGHMAAFDAGCAALQTAIASFPEWAQIWCGRYFIQNFADRFRTALATEVNRVIRGQKSDGPDFFTANSALFSGVHKALDTMSASAKGSGPGRRVYTVRNGTLSGISGGLILRDGERVCLLENDAETKRMLEIGALGADGEAAQ